jgi:hypothetical protein
LSSFYGWIEKDACDQLVEWVDKRCFGAFEDEEVSREVGG